MRRKRRPREDLEPSCRPFCNYHHHFRRISHILSYLLRATKKWSRGSLVRLYFFNRKDVQNRKRSSWSADHFPWLPTSPIWKARKLTTRERIEPPVTFLSSGLLKTGGGRKEERCKWVLERRLGFSGSSQFHIPCSMQCSLPPRDGQSLWTNCEYECKLHKSWFSLKFLLFIWAAITVKVGVDCVLEKINVGTHVLVLWLAARFPETLGSKWIGEPG